MNQLLRRASPVNLRAGIEPDLKHVADDLFLQGHSRGRSYVGAKAILERGIAGVGWEELDLDRRAFFRGQTVDVPIERLSAGIGELATQRGVRAVSRAQLPVVEELDGIDGIHAALFQELGVDVPEMPHAQNGEVRFGLGFNGDYLGARFCRRSEGGAAGVAEPDNEDVAIDSFGDVGLGDWGRRLSPACARDVVRRAFIPVVGGHFRGCRRAAGRASRNARCRKACGAETGSLEKAATALVFLFAGFFATCPLMLWDAALFFQISSNADFERERWTE